MVAPEEGDRVPRGATELEKAKEPEKAKDGTTGGTGDKVS